MEVNKMRGLSLMDQIPFLNEKADELMSKIDLILTILWKTTEVVDGEEQEQEQSVLLQEEKHSILFERRRSFACIIDLQPIVKYFQKTFPVFILPTNIEKTLPGMDQVYRLRQEIGLFLKELYQVMKQIKEWKEITFQLIQNALDEMPTGFQFHQHRVYASLLMDLVVKYIQLHLMWGEQSKQIPGLISLFAFCTSTSSSSTTTTTTSSSNSNNSTFNYEEKENGKESVFFEFDTTWDQVREYLLLYGDNPVYKIQNDFLKMDASLQNKLIDLVLSCSSMYLQANKFSFHEILDEMETSLFHPNPLKNNILQDLFYLQQIEKWVLFFALFLPNQLRRVDFSNLYQEIAQNQIIVPIFDTQVINFHLLMTSRIHTSTSSSSLSSTTIINTSNSTTSTTSTSSTATGINTCSKKWLKQIYQKALESSSQTHRERRFFLLNVLKKMFQWFQMDTNKIIGFLFQWSFACCYLIKNEMEWCFYHEDYFSYSNTLYTFTTCTTKTKINPFCFSQEMGELIGYLQLFRTIFKRFYCFPKKQKNTMTNQQQEKENFTMLHTSTSSIQGFYIKYFTQTHQNTIQSHLECIKKKLQETKKPIDSHIFQFLDQLDHLLTKTFLKNLKQFRQEWINLTFLLLFFTDQFSMDFFEQMDRIYCQSFYLDSFEKILEQKTLFSRNLWKKHQQFQRFFQQNCILPPLLPPRANQVTTTTCSTTYSSSTIGIGNTSIEFSLQIICYWIEIQCVAKQKTIDVIAQFYPIKTTTDPMKLLNMTLFFVNSFLSSKMLQWIGQKFQHTLQKIIEQEFLLHLKLTPMETIERLERLHHKYQQTTTTLSSMDSTRIPHTTTTTSSSSSSSSSSSHSNEQKEMLPGVESYPSQEKQTIPKLIQAQDELIALLEAFESFDDKEQEQEQQYVYLNANLKHFLLVKTQQALKNLLRGFVDISSGSRYVSMRFSPQHMLIQVTTFVRTLKRVFRELPYGLTNGILEILHMECHFYHTKKHAEGLVKPFQVPTDLYEINQMTFIGRITLVFVRLLQNCSLGITKTSSLVGFLACFSTNSFQIDPSHGNSSQANAAIKMAYVCTHPEQMDALCKLIGTEGIRIIEAALVQLILDQTRGIKKCILQEKKYLQKLSRNYKNSQLSFENIKNMHSLDEMLLLLIQMGTTLFLKRLLLHAKKRVFEKETPLLSAYIKTTTTHTSSSSSSSSSSSITYDTSSRNNQKEEQEENMNPTSINTCPCNEKEKKEDFFLLNVLLQKEFVDVFLSNNQEKEWKQLFSFAIGACFHSKHWKQSTIVTKYGKNDVFDTNVHTIGLSIHLFLQVFDLDDFLLMDICSTMILQLRSMNKDFPTPAMNCFMDKFFLKKDEKKTNDKNTKIKVNCLEHVFPHLLTTTSNNSPSYQQR